MHLKNRLLLCAALFAVAGLTACQGTDPQCGDGTPEGEARCDTRVCGDGTVDSNEQSFKMAGILAFKTVAPKCKPVLLEPLSEIEVTTPDEYMGDVLGDLSSRRGHILGTEAIDSGTTGSGTRVRAIVPEAELHTYAGTLQSMTQGRATFTK